MAAYGRSSDGPAGRDWRCYGADPGGSKYSPLAQIDRGNVARLERVRTYHTGETDQGRPAGQDLVAFECTPLAVDGVLYLSTPASRVIALEGETGRELWTYDPQVGIKQRLFVQHRGVSFWESGSERRIEPYLLDFDGDLYGQRLIVEFWRRLRDERAFESEEDLVLQMARDVEATRLAEAPV